MVNTRRSVGGKKLKEETTAESISALNSLPPTPGVSSKEVKPEESGFNAREPIQFVDQDAMRSPPRQSVVHQSTEVVRRARTQARQVPKRTWRSLFGSLGLLYLAAVYVFVCRGDPNSENGFCQAFQAAGETRQDILNYAHKHAQPYLRHAQPYLDQAQAHVEPYVSRVRPHYARASSFSSPYITKGRKAYDTHVTPALTEGQRQAAALAQPYLDTARSYHAKHVDPQWQHYQRLGRKLYASNVEPTLDRTRKLAQPHLDNAQNVYLPAASRYYNDVAAPYAVSAYGTSRDTYVKQVHPRLLDGYTGLRVFLQHHVFPVVRRYHAVYIRPQVDRVLQKIWESKTRKAATEAIVQAEAKEKVIAEEEGTDDLDAFIEELRDETHQAEEATVPVVDQAAAAEEERIRQHKLKQASGEMRRELEAKRDRYEGEIEALAKTERLLLIERLNSVRAAASHDVPARFDSRIKDLRSEASKLQAKLEKYFDRVAGDDRLNVEEKIQEAELITSKAVTRLSTRAESIHDEIDAYGRTHFEKEANAVQKAFSAVQELVGSAQQELGHGWTWLEDVTVKDWSRYHQLQKTEDSVHGDFRALASGSTKDARLAGLRPEDVLAQYRDVTDKIVDDFEHSIESARKAGAKRLRGTVGDSVRGAYEQAKSAFGVDVPEPTPSDLAGSASSVLSVATETVASVYESLASGVDLHEATRSISRAVGATPTPESAQEYAESVYAKASKAVAGEPEPANIVDSLSSAATVASSSVSSFANQAGASASSAYSVVADTLASSLPGLDDLSSGVHDATRAAIRAAGATPSPESPGEYAQFAYGEASKAVMGQPAGVAGQVGSPASKVLSSASSISKSVASSVPGVDDISSSVHDATRAAMRAAGATPSPESVGEYAESVYERASRAVAGEDQGGMESVVSKASATASSIASVVSSQAADAASQASGSASSVYSIVGGSLPSIDDLSSSLHSATRVAARALGATPSPEGASEYAESVYARASQAAVGEPAASGVSASVSSAVSVASGSASSVASAIGSQASSAYDSLDDPISSASSLASVVSASAASQASVVSSQASSAYSNLPSVDDLSSSLSSLVAPSPPSAGDSISSAYSRASDAFVGTPAASGVSVSVSSGVDGVSSSVSSALSAASSVVHDATRSAVRAVGGEPSPEGVREHVESATRAVSRKVMPSPPSAADEARNKVEEAVQSARDAADRVAQRLEL